jgi:polar amino acid transport system substrate-binding protein
MASRICDPQSSAIGSTTTRRPVLIGGLAALLGAASGKEAGAASLAPMRMAVLDGNPVQARADRQGRLHGPGIAMLDLMARRLGRPHQIEAIAGTGPLIAALRESRVDIACIAYAPERGAGLRFTSPYLLSLNRFAVATPSPLRDSTQVDRPGVRLGTIVTDTGGLFLKRTIRQAAIIPVMTTEEGVARLLKGEIDVFGGAAQRLLDLGSAGGFRMLDGRFHDVPQCLAVRADDPGLFEQAEAAVHGALSEGTIARAIRQFRLGGAIVPPTGYTLSPPQTEFPG